MQSLEDATLKEVHRSNAASIISALEHICSAKNATPNPENISINIDMILGLPYTPYGHTHESILLLLRKFPAITHTSIYMLEDDIYPSHWKQISLDEQSIQQEFLTIRETLMAHGWHHYELSNFSSP